MSAIICGSHVVLSIDGAFIGYANGSRVTVSNTKRNSALLKDTTSNDFHEKQISNEIYQCCDKIDYFEFSNDSCYILCLILSRACIQVFSLKDRTWTCRINEGVAGLIRAYWMPDSRHIIAESDYGIQLNIWSLIDSTASIISNPKANSLTSTNPSNKLYGFSDCGQYLAVIHRLELHDYVGIFSCSPLGELNKFKAKSSDIACLKWVPNGTHIITIDSPLNYAVHVYTPAGELIASYEAYQNALGIKYTVANRVVFNRTELNAVENQQINNVASGMSNTPLMFAVGSFDGKVRLISMYSWQLVFVFPLLHPKEISETGLDCSENITITEIASNSIQNSLNSTSNNVHNNRNVNDQKSIPLLSDENSHILFNSNKYEIKPIKSLPKRGNDHKSLLNNKNNSSSSSVSNSLPLIGVSWIGWSYDSSFLAARDDAYPRCLWIFNPLETKLVSLIIQLETIVASAWQPISYNSNNDRINNNKMLAFSCGSSRLYFWSPSFGASWYDIRSTLSPSLNSIDNSKQEKRVSQQPSTSRLHSTNHLIKGKSGTDNNYSKPVNLALSHNTNSSNAVPLTGLGVNVKSLAWNENGDNLLIRGKDFFVVVDVKSEEFMNIISFNSCGQSNQQGILDEKNNIDNCEYA
eukprot:gene10727-14408_t